MKQRIRLTKKEKIVFMVVVAIHTLLLYLLSNYSKAMETYADELVYYDIAKSIFEGTGFLLHGVDLNFSKLAYSFVLLPTFLISDVSLRVHSIMLINSLLMSVPVPLTYLMCRELNVKKNYCIMAAALICFWPDIVISGTFMSENLFFPLSVLCFYYILLSYKYKKRKFFLMIIILSIFAYFTKEIGICVILSYVAAEMISAIISRVSDKKTQSMHKHEMPSESKKKTLPGARKIYGVSQIIFAIMAAIIAYFTIRLIFFGGLSNSYIASGAMDFSYFADGHAVLYLVYAILYYLAAVTLAFFVLPVIMPVLGYKRLTTEARKFLLYTVLLYLGSILVITVTITAREDFGKIVPAVHLRYLSQLFVPFVCIFFAGLSNDDKLESGDLKVIITVMIATGAVFKGVYNTCTTGNIALLYIYPLRKLVPDMKIASGDFKLYPAGAVTACIFLAAIILFFCIGRKNKPGAIMLFFTGTLLLSAVNIGVGLRNVYDTYNVDDELIAEMVEIDDYFRKNDLDKSKVAFVDDSQFSKETKVYDLYFRSADKEYMILGEDIGDVLEYQAQQALKQDENMSGEIASIVLTEPVWRNTYTPETIDYIIISRNNEAILQEVLADTVLSKTELIEPDIPNNTVIPEISGSRYAVYKISR